MDFTILASNFMRPHHFLDLELQNELEFSITTIELAVIDNVGLHGCGVRFCEIGLIKSRRKNEQHVRQIPVRPVGWRSMFLSCLWTEKNPKSLFDSGFQDAPLSTGLNFARAPYTKSYFGGIHFSCSTILCQYNASRITF